MHRPSSNRRGVRIAVMLSVMALASLARAHDPYCQQSALTPSQPISGESFGIAIDVDGDFLVAGAPSPTTGGRAIVFQRRGTSWVEIAELIGQRFGPDDSFGAHVAPDRSPCSFGGIAS